MGSSVAAYYVILMNSMIREMKLKLTRNVVQTKSNCVAMKCSQSAAQNFVTMVFLFSSREFVQFSSFGLHLFEGELQ